MTTKNRRGRKGVHPSRRKIPTREEVKQATYNYLKEGGKITKVIVNSKIKVNDDFYFLNENADTFLCEL